LPAIVLDMQASEQQLWTFDKSAVTISGAQLLKT
jgi:hypothetical protein